MSDESLLETVKRGKETTLQQTVIRGGNLLIGG
jgi:hypothetical protein